MTTCVQRTISLFLLVVLSFGCWIPPVGAQTTGTGKHPLLSPGSLLICKAMLPMPAVERWRTS